MILCGHTHKAYITHVGDERDAWGQPCPVVVGASPKAIIESDQAVTPPEGVYVGSGMEWNKKDCTVSFCGSDGTVYYTERLSTS